MKAGKITEVYADSYFNTKKSFKDIQSSLSNILILQILGRESELLCWIA